MLGFAAHGGINGAPVFRICTPLELISGHRDVNQKKDLDDTHLLTYTTLDVITCLTGVDPDL